MTNIIVSKHDFDGSNIGINGVVRPIPLDNIFDADAATIEVLRNAGIPFLQEPFDLGATGQIRISRSYRGPRFVVVNGVRSDFPVGQWFSPSASALPLIMARVGSAVLTFSLDHPTTLTLTFSDGSPLQFSDNSYLELAA